MAKKVFFINSALAQYTDEEFSFIWELFDKGVFGDNAGAMGLQVTQNGTPAMNVLVSAGKALVNLTKSSITWKTIFVSNAQETLTIASNSSGVNRVDAIILRVDKDAEPNALKNNIGTIEVVLGSGATALTDNAISTAIGSDGFYRLADITVSNGATSIVTANIADTRTKVATNNYATILDNITSSPFPIGAISPYAGRVAPNNFLMCDGSLVSRTGAYANLFNVLCAPSVFTVTIANPAVFTKVAHELVAGDKIHITTTGGLPSGLSTNTDYYVLSTGLTADTFRVALAPEGTAIITTGSQSGVHTFYLSSYGKGDGSTTFALPDLRSKSVIGKSNTAPTISIDFESAQVDVANNKVTVPDNNFPYQGQKVRLTTNGTLPTGLAVATDYYIVRVSTSTIGFATDQSSANAGSLIDITGAGSGIHTIVYTQENVSILGKMGGEESHALSKGQIPSHTHGIPVRNGGSSGSAISTQAGNVYNTIYQSDANTPADQVHNNMSPYIALNYIIRY